MNLSLKWCLLIVLAAGVALLLRLPGLDLRPMHADEAVNAIKFGELLEEKNYTYNPEEFHGPTLSYFSLILARLHKYSKISQVSEAALRIVPVIFGILLILLVYLISDGLGKIASVFTALLAAVSPAFVFYSRYYIHEMLLVFFAFALVVCAYRYIKCKNIFWAIFGGLSAGLMFATKETSVLAFVSMLLACLLLRIEKPASERLPFFKIIRPVHFLLFIISAIIVSVVFYSSFFKNPQGIADSVSTYRNYLVRGFENNIHSHPWYYYLRILIWPANGSIPVVSESLILLLAFYCLVLSAVAKAPKDSDINLMRFISFYTFVLTVIYCLMPYKTPWCLLSFFFGMILMAGFAISAIISYFTRPLIRVLTVLLFSLGLLGLALQSYVSSFMYYADPANPYVYAHTSKDIFVLRDRFQQIAAASLDGHQVRINVIVSQNYWPLPWYLRSFPNTGYYKKFDSSVKPAQIFIISAGFEKDAANFFYELPPPGEQHLYVPLFDSMTLRPGVELLGLVTSDLAEKINYD